MVCLQKTCSQSFKIGCSKCRKDHAQHPNRLISLHDFHNMYFFIHQGYANLLDIWRILLLLSWWIWRKKFNIFAIFEPVFSKRKFNLSTQTAISKLPSPPYWRSTTRLGRLSHTSIPSHCCRIALNMHSTWLNARNLWLLTQLREIWSSIMML